MKNLKLQVIEVCYAITQIKMNSTKISNGFREDIINEINEEYSSFEAFSSGSRSDT